jgi:hypothetical protein
MLNILPFCLSDPQAVLGSEIWQSLTDGDEAVLAEIRNSGLSPFLYFKLKQYHWESLVPAKIRTKIFNDYALLLRTATLQDQEMAEILSLFQHAGVEVLLLKGGDLRFRVYPDPALRPMCDLDILIHPEHLPQAKKALLQQGFTIPLGYLGPTSDFSERFGNELTFWPPPDKVLPVDVHWEIRGVCTFYRLPTPSLFRQAQSVRIGGLPVKVLSPEHLLIHLCLHAFNDKFVYELAGYEPLKMTDIALLLSKLPPDWQVFGQEVANFKCQVPVFIIMNRINQLFHSMVPPAILASLSTYRPNLVERVLIKKYLGYLTTYLPFFHHHSWRDWLRFLSAKLWPDPQYLTYLFGKPDRLAYLGHFFQNFKKS